MHSFAFLSISLFEMQAFVLVSGLSVSDRLITKNFSCSSLIARQKNARSESSSSIRYFQVSCDADGEAQETGTRFTAGWRSPDNKYVYDFSRRKLLLIVDPPSDDVEKLEDDMDVKQERRSTVTDLSSVDPDKPILIDDTPRRLFDTGYRPTTKRIIQRIESRSPEEKKRMLTNDNPAYRNMADYEMQALVKKQNSWKNDPPRTYIGNVTEEQSQEELRRLQLDLTLTAAVLGVAGTAFSYVAFGQNLGASYGLGALGGLGYLYLLGRRVETGLGGPAALAIPLLLALASRKYDQLELLPSLLGFFSYKASVLLYTFRTAVLPENPGIAEDSQEK
mmetsp:Transcript_16588/g.27419  ORF Transcript_16588/g.27419 Transcript_16588/m.27419 type:complete len:335 (+) Transcript_16588:25-1029(+)